MCVCVCLCVSVCLCMCVYVCVCVCVCVRERERERANRVLRRIFGSKTDDVTGQWRKLHNEERNDLYCSPDIFQVIK